MRKRRGQNRRKINVRSIVRTGVAYKRRGEKRTEKEEE